MELTLTYKNMEAIFIKWTCDREPSILSWSKSTVILKKKQLICKNVVIIVSVAQRNTLVLPIKLFIK